MKIKHTKTYEVKIFIAGEYNMLKEECQKFCDEVGLCVTVTPTNYVYTNGEETGAIIGLINYARFPKHPQEIFEISERLALKLRIAAAQTSFTIQDDKTSSFYSWRDYE